ncbi:hypothetical protein [Pontibacter harenae]|uniref:hypothetical protein n=1 Tax=Pontibacter harenae TaxID=2894083 RepID=UPI001E47D719|nr:hypothetical protein [Pontibacter harenae]MCC9167402.1 hypothetical protein [Pontibacter harenae]
MRKILLLVVVVASLVAGCTESFVEPDPKARGLEYYPLHVGDYHIYNVRDIKYQHNVAVVDSIFQMREVVTDTFRNQANELTYKVVRSIRKNESGAWLEDSVLTVVKSEHMVVLSKNNTKYIKLVFPVEEGKKWLGDAFNNNIVNDLATDPYLRKESYSYQNVGKPLQIGENTYPESLTVVQGNPADNVVFKDERKEVYAKGVGKVYRLFNRVVYASCTPEDCVYGEGYKLNGHERTEELASYGKL